MTGAAAEAAEELHQAVSTEGSGGSRRGRGREEEQRKQKGRKAVAAGGFSSRGTQSGASPFPNSPFLRLSFDSCSLAVGVESGL